MKKIFIYFLISTFSFCESITIFIHFYKIRESTSFCCCKRKGQPEIIGPLLSKINMNGDISFGDLKKAVIQQLLNDSHIGHSMLNFKFEINNDEKYNTQDDNQFINCFHLYLVTVTQV